MTLTWGWWNIDPGKCEAVAPFNPDDELKGAGNYYYHARSSAGIWQGDLRLCVKLTGDFTMSNPRSNEQERCTGGEFRSFRPLNLTGQDSVLNLEQLH